MPNASQVSPAAQEHRARQDVDQRGRRTDPAALRYARGDARLARQGAARGTLRQNEWQTTELAARVVIPDLLKERAWKNVDYLKIDIDRDDHEVLLSFDGRFEEFGLMALQLEVMFIGSEADRQHTFHSTDRFMRRQGFELFDLEVRRYSARALPGRYIWPTPAESVFGRPFMGEAYYALDPVAGKARGGTLGVQRL
jgi:hypothetical protein